MNQRITRWIVLSLIVLPLAACGRQESDQQRAEAAATFQEAREHLRRVRSGVIHQAVAEPSGEARRALEAADAEVSVQKHDESIREYRQAQLEQAAEKLKPLTRSGSSAQRLAAHRLIAETHASAARFSQQEAVQAWSEQAALLSELRGLASAIQRAHTAATAQSKVDRSEELAELRSSEETLTGEIDGVQEDIESLQQKIDSQKQQIAQHQKQRREKTQEADKLARKAFQTEGQAGHDLHRKASALEREADKLSAKAEKATARLDVKEKRMALLTTELENKQSRLEEIGASIEALQQRQAGTDDLTQQRRQRVQELAEEFQSKFETLAQQQQERIDQPFTEAGERMRQAVEQLDQAVQAAPSDSRDNARLALAARRTELGLALEEQAEIHAAVNEALSSLTNGLEDGLPQQAGAVSDVADEAATRASEAIDAATEALSASVEELSEIAESAGDAAVERPARRHLIQAHRALARIEGNSHEDAIQQQREQLQELEGEEG